MSAPTTGATPRPWEALMEWADGAEIIDSLGYEVAELNTGGVAINRRWVDEHPDQHWGSGGEAASIDRPQDEIEANARLIVEAVNERDALLRVEEAAQPALTEDLAAALRIIAEPLDEVDVQQAEYVRIAASMIDDLRAALASLDEARGRAEGGAT